MIRFSHSANTWQLYIGAGCWMYIDADTARYFADRCDILTTGD